jgi:3-oxoadipate enol-lactonase
MPFAQLSGVSIHYEWNGPEAAPVLIFSHSLGANYQLWDAQLEAFSRHFRILRYDTRGHGESGVPQGPYTIAQLAGDVVQLLDVVGVRRASFCGISMGGTTGMYLAANYPDRFYKIALCNTGAKIGTADFWNARIEAIRKGGMSSVSNALIERWFTFDFRSSHPEEVAEIKNTLDNTDPEGYVANCAVVRDADLHDSLAKIKTPTLVVAGLHDTTATPAHARVIADGISGARVVDLNAAHLSNIEARDAFNHEVLSFFTH